MGRIIAIANQKGGVGKTTSAVNLSVALADKGKRVLVVDIDPQANTSTALGAYDEELTIETLLLSKSPDVKSTIVNAKVAGDILKNVDIIPSPANQSLAIAAEKLAAARFRELKLAKQLQLVENDYDFILIDTNPALNVLTINAICSATEFIVPTNYGPNGLVGINQLLDTIAELKDIASYDDIPYKILRSRVDFRVPKVVEFGESVLETHNDKVFHTRILESSDVSKSESEFLPVFFYNKKSRIVKCYSDLAEELINDK